MLTSISVPASEFARLAPIGALALASLENVGVVTDTADTIDFTFSVEQGEAVSAIAAPANAGAILTIEYLDASGVIASSTASGVGESTVLPFTPLDSDGVASVRVTSNVPTEFNLNIYRNVLLEEAIGESGPGNMLTMMPTEIDGLSRYSALGSTSLARNGTTVFSESFDASTAFHLLDLWHVSTGRANDGLPNHSARGLYFGQAELGTTPTGTLNWDAEFDFSSNRLWESSAKRFAKVALDFWRDIESRHQRTTE